MPLGSILGPLLYLIYVNDIGNSCDGNILSFADDTTGKLYELANKQINDLFEWFWANKLKPQNIKCDLTNVSIKINGTCLERIGNDCNENATKFLGMYIDENLSWKHHLSQLNKKVSQALFSIKQVKKSLPLECLRTRCTTDWLTFFIWYPSIGKCWKGSPSTDFQVTETSHTCHW